MKDIDSLTEILLIEWNRKTLDNNYKGSFGQYVKDNCPILYDAVVREELENWKLQYRKPTKQ